MKYVRESWPRLLGALLGTFLLRCSNDFCVKYDLSLFRSANVMCGSENWLQPSRPTWSLKWMVIVSLAYLELLADNEMLLGTCVCGSEFILENFTAKYRATASKMAEKLHGSFFAVRCTWCGNISEAVSFFFRRMSPDVQNRSLGYFAFWLRLSLSQSLV